ncbi:uncharacterized protein F5Z01DRAFT_147472 [Emericellopsis atlantica]|uniref:Uncharacterized protein n=1 Tax=Emericellopsis atlantica TaxID=2614577 RepID=A0A9P7ZK29_9HYPO|nr:uncharacterized protein F5Z01DRAFT_147472 [Emericellopsis atlantica]KAG9253583.1 hypothetical protein F5Z01DRAFT_147472 [Emericellopsis atlantica]
MGNVEPNGWRMASDRARGGPGGRGAKRFAQTKSMQSIKALQTQQRDEEEEKLTREREESAQLEVSPRGTYFIADLTSAQGAFIIASDSLVPDEIKEEGFFDQIAKDTGCTIEESTLTGVPFMLILRSQDKMQMDAAHNAIANRLHILRQIQRSFSRTLFLQPPARSDWTAMISLEVSERPFVIGKNLLRGPPAAEHPAVMSSLLDRLVIDVPNAAYGAMNLPSAQFLEMRISFGRLNIEKRRKDVPDELSYRSFEKALQFYQNRGHAAALATRLADLQNVDEAIKLLTCRGGPGLPMDECTRRNELITTILESEMHSELRAVILEKRLGNERLEQPVAVPHLDWCAIAPEEDFDWMLRINSTISQEMPTRCNEYLKNISFEWSKDEPMEAFELLKPRLNRPWTVKGLDIIKTCVKSSLIVPLAGTQYVVEVSATRQWDDKLQAEPLTTWSIEMYSEHWEEAMNLSGRDGRDWGSDFKDVWHEEAPGQSLRQRLEQFVRCILTVQDTLRGLSTAEQVHDNSEKQRGIQEETEKTNHDLIDLDFTEPPEALTSPRKASDAMSTMFENMDLGSGHEEKDSDRETDSSEDLIEL